MLGLGGGIKKKEKKKNVVQSSPLTHTSKELGYLPNEVDTKKDHPSIELEGPWRADPIRSVCRCPNQMAKQEIPRWIPGLVGARSEPLCTMFLLLYHVPCQPQILLWPNIIKHTTFFMFSRMGTSGGRQTKTSWEQFWTRMEAGGFPVGSVATRMPPCHLLW